MVDGIGGQTPRFEMHAIAHDDDAIECQTRFRAVPGNELFDGVLIDATGTGRSEAVQHRQLGMIQIRETKYGPTIVSFCFPVSHAGGLQFRSRGLGHNMGLRKKRRLR